MKAILKPWAYWLRPPKVDLRARAKALTIVISNSMRTGGVTLRSLLRKFDSANVMELRDEDLADYIDEIKIEYPNWRNLVAQYLK